MNFDVKGFSDGSVVITERMLSDYRTDHKDSIPLLYQTGYLTIADYDETADCYTLGFPNDEVKYGFLENLIGAYADDSDTRMLMEWKVVR